GTLHSHFDSASAGGKFIQPPRFRFLLPTFYHLLLQVTTLGQPLEVLKTQMAANRAQTMLQATKTVWSRGGIAGFYQGLIPWVRPLESFVKFFDVLISFNQAWIEASTKGAVLIFAASEIEERSVKTGLSPAVG